jgi:hypothetical protein
MKKRIFAVALALLLSVGILTGLHKITINPNTTVADVITPNGGEPPNW